jgi:hypothetical protein
VVDILIRSIFVERVVEDELSVLESSCDAVNFEFWLMGDQARIDRGYSIDLPLALFFLEDRTLTDDNSDS